MTCKICREEHDPGRGLSFDGKGINSCGMYRARLATLTEAGQQSNLGSAFALVPDMLELLNTILARLDMEPREAIFPCSAMRDDIRALIDKAK